MATAEPAAKQNEKASKLVRIRVFIYELPGLVAGGRRSRRTGKDAPLSLKRGLPQKPSAGG